MDRPEPDREGPCADAPADIEDLLDGLLDPEAVSALRDHLDECVACRASLAAEEDLRRRFGGEPDARAPAGFADGVMARIRHERAPRRRILLFPGVAAAAALLVLAALVGRGWLTEYATGPLTEKAPVAGKGPGAQPASEPAGSPRARDLVRRARLFLAVAEQTPEAVLSEELERSGLGEAVAALDLEGLGAGDRDAVRRVSLLCEAWQNGAPVSGGEVAMLMGGVR